MGRGEDLLKRGLGEIGEQGKPTQPACSQWIQCALAQEPFGRNRKGNRGQQQRRPWDASLVRKRSLLSTQAGSNCPGSRWGFRAGTHTRAGRQAGRMARMARKRSRLELSGCLPRQPQTPVVSGPLRGATFHPAQFGSNRPAAGC